MICLLLFSYAMMDLLVDLCLQNHLNPSHHVLEIWSSETQQPLSFKPNTLIGSLNVHTVLLKEKVPEDKIKSGQPKVPEVSGACVLSEDRQICAQCAGVLARTGLFLV